MDLTARQADLRDQLVQAITTAMPVMKAFEENKCRVDCSYRAIAEVLVRLRHEFKGSHGEPHDLAGRSKPYRVVVKVAYAHVGADPLSPISKRMTAGTAYWVRKLLLEKYGEEQLHAWGILGNPVGAKSSSNYSKLLDGIQKDDPHHCLVSVVGLLNMLATDPAVEPTEEVIRSAMRAVALLKTKVPHRQATAA